MCCYRVTCFTSAELDTASVVDDKELWKQVRCVQSTGEIGASSIAEGSPISSTIDPV